MQLFMPRGTGWGWGGGKCDYLFIYLFIDTVVPEMPSCVNKKGISYRMVESKWTQ